MTDALKDYHAGQIAGEAARRLEHKPKLTYYAEFDLMEWARDKINRKVESDGEKALEGALAEVGFVRERTCHNTIDADGCFACSACGETLEDARQEAGFVKWCPFCGAKVVKQ